MRRNRSRGLVVFAVMALLGGCGKRGEKPPEQMPISEPTPASVAPAPPPTLIFPEAVAELAGSAETPVVTVEAGYLVHQFVKEHALVKAGEPLFLLDPRTSHAGATPGAQLNFGLQIKAPVSGEVGHASHAAGDWVNAWEQLTMIATIDPIEARLTAPEDFYDRNSGYFEQLMATLRASRPANIELIMPEGRTYPQRGVVLSVQRASKDAPVAITVEFPNPALVLQVGEFVRVRGSAHP